LITTFWLLVSALMLTAFLIILPPLWRKRDVPKDDQDQLNITIAAQRLAELKAQLQAGALSQSQYDDQFAELEAALNDDLDLAHPVKTKVSQGRWVVFVLILALPLGALSLYGVLGNYRALTVSATATTPEMAQINDMVAGLAARLKKQPEDAQGWLMLGRSYRYLDQHAEAAAALAQAYHLLGEQPEVMLSYADSMAMANGGILAGKPAELVFKVLAMEPDNVTGLWLGGLAKAEQGDLATAINWWRKLETLLPAGSESQQEVQALIAKVTNKQTERATKAGPSDKLAAMAVQVTLAPDLQQSVNPSDTVFVYAQALSGPQMPVAIVRKQVADLPLTLSLTDNMAMMPAMKLSNFAQVKLVARISKSGNAVQQTGDLIGIIEPVVVADTNSHKIVIKDTVK
jgi:cytochrome c-type biogenesis protein CcmH